MVHSNSGNGGYNDNSKHILDKYLNKNNLNVTISKSETVIVCLTILFAFLAFGISFITYKMGEQAEKIGQIEDIIFNNTYQIIKKEIKNEGK